MHTQPILLVMAPHPDDAVLGAGGLIQRAQQHGWRVVVVHMTHGDGFLLSTWRMRRRIRPVDYVMIGTSRRREATAALRVLGVDTADCIFLGFPDGQLSHLSSYPLRSPTTHWSQDSYPDSPSVGYFYTLTYWMQAIRQLLTAYPPQLMIYPDFADTNADHQATGQLCQSLTIGQPTLTYQIHGRGSRSPQTPQTIFPLTSQERARKQWAIALHASQMAVTGWWLNGFAQSTERYGNLSVCADNLLQ